MPNPAHVGSCHGDRSPDIFPGRKPNLGCYEGTCGVFFVRWDHSWLTGDLKDPRMKDLLRVRAQCVHDGPQNPTHPPHVEDKHRHFNIVLLLLEKKNYSVTFLCFFPLVSTSPAPLKKAREWMCVPLWCDPFVLHFGKLKRCSGQTSLEKACREKTSEVSDRLYWKLDQMHFGVVHHGMCSVLSFKITFHLLQDRAVTSSVWGRPFNRPGILCWSSSPVI